MAQAIELLLVTPPLVQDMGLFKVDPIELALGVSLEDLLADLLLGPRRRMPSPEGVMSDVYPLALPDGEGACIPLGDLGEIGFRNLDGLLELSVPHAVSQRVYDRVREYAVQRPEVVPGVGGGWCTRMVLRLPRGGRARVGVGGWEFGLWIP